MLISISNSEPLESQGLKVVCVQCFFRNYFRHSHEQRGNPAGRVQRTSSNLRGLGETFRQRTKPSHGGRLTSAGAPKQCFPRAAERDTAPAIRTDRTAALHNPLQKITAFNDSNPVGQIDQGGICVAAFGPPTREDRVRNRSRRPDGACGSGQFAASALDMLSAARNRVTGKPALSRARVGGLREWKRSLCRGPIRMSAIRAVIVRSFCSCPVFVAHHLSASGSMA